MNLVDDLTRDIRYAFRTFRRAPLAALTIVATVALGLGLVAVVFTVYNIFFLRADAVRSPGELFAVELKQRMDPTTNRTLCSRGPTTTRCAARPASSLMPLRCDRPDP